MGKVWLGNGSLDVCFFFLLRFYVLNRSLSPLYVFLSFTCFEVLQIRRNRIHRALILMYIYLPLPHSNRSWDYVCG
jgi:hypothetical protein